MEETLYFDSRPSTGYNGYYEFYVDTIPENWVGSLNTDADWVLIYRYSKNRYNILVDSNISNGANTEPRSCIISGYFETVADEIYSATTGDSVTITIHQSGYTLPDGYALVPIEITAYQTTTRDWSYIIENCSDELMDYVSAASVSIMYSISDGETKRISPEDIIATSGNSGNFFSAATSVGSPVFSINTDSHLARVSGYTNLHYFTVPSIKKVFVDDKIYTLTVNHVDSLKYNEHSIDVTVKSNANGNIGLYSGHTLIGQKQTWSTPTIGGEDVQYRFQFTIPGEAILCENYTISATTTELYGNSTSVSNFVRDVERYTRIGIKKTGDAHFEYDLIEIDSGASQYDLQYECNYSLEDSDSLILSLSQDAENQLTTSGNCLNTVVPVHASGLSFYSLVNSLDDYRYAVIDATVNGHTEIPKATISIKQDYEPITSIVINISGFGTEYDYDATGGSATIRLTPVNAIITGLQGTGNFRNISYTKDVQHNYYICNFQFNGVNTSREVEQYAITVNASYKQLTGSSQFSFVRNVNNSNIVLKGTYINGDSGTHVIDTSYLGFVTQQIGATNNYYVSFTVKMAEDWSSDVNAVIYVESANIDEKNTITVPTIGASLVETACNQELINRYHVSRVMYYEAFQIIPNPQQPEIRPQQTITFPMSTASTPTFNLGDALNVYVIAYENIH